MLLLMRETLARKRLTVPIRAISLRVDDLTSDVASPPRDLFAQRSSEHDEAYAGFIDRLRARCGEQALRSLRLRGGHRPEYASAWQRPILTGGRRGSVPLPATPRARHPLWLLERPLRLAVRGDRPVFDGPLRLDRERERIQSGWWDEPGIDRDYFVATTARGGRLWIYRELEGGRRWYLHGIFD